MKTVLHGVNITLSKTIHRNCINVEKRLIAPINCRGLLPLFFLFFLFHASLQRLK